MPTNLSLLHPIQVFILMTRIRHNLRIPPRPPLPPPKKKQDIRQNELRQVVSLGEFETIQYWAAFCRIESFRAWPKDPKASGLISVQFATFMGLAKKYFSKLGDWSQLRGPIRLSKDLLQRRNRLGYGLAPAFWSAIHSLAL